MCLHVMLSHLLWITLTSAQVSSLHFGQNVEMTFGASGCDQGSTLLLLCLCFLAVSSLLSFNFCIYFFILVFVAFFRSLKSHKGKNNIRVLSTFLAIQIFPQASEEVFQKRLDIDRPVDYQSQF